jgi:hypothetical protein
MKIKKYITLLISTMSLFLILACEGYQCGVGTVYDSSNNQPLDSVLCVSNGGDEILTDSTGNFDVCGPFGGCVKECPEVEVEFSKEGYVSQKKTDDFKSVYLEKE